MVEPCNSSLCLPEMSPQFVRQTPDKLTVTLVAIAGRSSLIRRSRATRTLFSLHVLLQVACKGTIQIKSAARFANDFDVVSSPARELILVGHSVHHEIDENVTNVNSQATLINVALLVRKLFKYSTVALEKQIVQKEFQKCVKN